MIDINTRKVTENWITLAVTALPPGWVNVYTKRDGITEYAEAAPALLLQESTTSTVTWIEGEGTNAKFRERTIDNEQRETRVVFAEGNTNYAVEAACDRDHYVWSCPAAEFPADAVKPAGP